jgi:hypothetical protein
MVFRPLGGVFHRHPVFTTMALDSGDAAVGVLSYNADKDTFNLTHKDGVTQQLGQEIYGHFINNTGSTIERGTGIGFAGANGEIEIQPYIADGTFPEVYFIGVAAQQLSDGEEGKITTWGEVSNINTTGGAENWQQGDILYASPTVSGGLTNVRPTAPDVVIIVAAVRTVDASEGIILVRPTIPMGLRYGTFYSDVDQVAGATNTATAVTFDGTQSSNGVAIGTPTSRIVVAQAGYYQFSVSMQFTSSSSSAKNAYVWLRKNGTDVANSTSKLTNDANNASLLLHEQFTISLEIDDYIEIMWAVDDLTLTLDAIPATAFSPAGHSVILNAVQLQL